MKKTIKILLTALTVALLACLLCMALSAESSGNCGSDGDGSNLTWELDDEGTLTIDGSGAMKSYSYGNAPWFSAVGGKPVKKVVIKSGCTSIGSYAFQSSSTNYIESVSLPDTLRTIGAYAFFLCKSLTEINIPSSVTNIYYFAFDGCSALEKLTLSEGVKAIGGNAFSGCIKLSEITIPSTVENKATYAFANCTGLKKITNLSNATISDDAFPTPSGSCGDNITWKIDLIECKLEITGTGEMPNYWTSGTKLAPWNSYKDSIKTVTISEGITSIGEYAFYSFCNYSCDNLTSVSLPSTLNSIGSGAFYCCESLESIVITFYGCTALQTVMLPKNLANIRRMAFTGSGLISIAIPDSVMTIEKFAFFDCRSLENVTLGKYAFYGSSAAKIAIPGSVTEINYNAFEACASLTEITLPLELGTIGQHAFKDCTSFVSFDFGDYLQDLGVEAFSGCTALTRVSLSGALKNLGSGVFNGCKSLISFYFSGENSKFYDENNMIFDNSGKRLFLACHRLKEIVIPEGVTVRKCGSCDEGK